jgi:hypothetical protein
MGERESVWLLIGLGGAAVFLTACAIAAGVGMGVILWAGWA